MKKPKPMTHPKPFVIIYCIPLLMAMLMAMLMASTLGCGGVTTEQNTADASASVDANRADAALADASVGLLSISGMINGEIPEGSLVVVIWSVTSGSPDYTYKFGQGVSSGNSFTVVFPKDPPVEALNAMDLGVGVVLTFPPNTSIADGIVDNALLNSSIGASPEGAIIFRKSGTLDISWASNFSIGTYECAQCSRNGNPFDDWKFKNCGSITVDVGDLSSHNFCNWT